MTIRDKILEELRKGTPLAEIRKKYESVSKTYEALRQFFSESDKIVEETQKKIEDLRNARTEEEEKLSQLKQENLKITQEKDELIQQRGLLTEEVARKTEERCRVNEDMAELSKRGYSPEIVRKISTIEAKTGPQLLRQVETVEKYLHAKRAFSKLKREKKDLKKEVLDLKKESKNLKELVIMHRNMLDELEVKVRGYEDAYSVVNDLLEHGYSVEDIVSLKSGLDHVQIRGDPKTSIKRLVEGLIKAKKLVTLDEKIEVGEKKLAVVKRETAETKQESDVVAKTTITAIECEKDAALNCIAKVGAEVHAKTEESTERFEAALKKGEEEIQRIVEACRGGLGEYGRLQQEAGRLNEHIYYGRILFGVLNSADYLRTIPPPIVAGILDRLAIWSDASMPEFSVKPSQRVIQKEKKLISAWTYNLTALLQLAAEGLRYQKDKDAGKHAGDSLA